MRVALANVERTWLKLADQCRRLDELIEFIESPAIAPMLENPHNGDPYGHNPDTYGPEDYSADLSGAGLEPVGSDDR